MPHSKHKHVRMRAAPPIVNVEDWFHNRERLLDVRACRAAPRGPKLLRLWSGSSRGHDVNAGSQIASRWDAPRWQRDGPQATIQLGDEKTADCLSRGVMARYGRSRPAVAEDHGAVFLVLRVSVRRTRGSERQKIGELLPRSWVAAGRLNDTAPGCR